MQNKLGSKSREGYSLATVGFASLENSEFDTDCALLAGDVSFLFEQIDEKNVIGRAFFIQIFFQSACCLHCRVAPGAA